MRQPNDTASLVQTIFRAKSQVELARNSLAVIGAYGRSTQQIRRRSYDLDGALDNERWFSQECLSETDAILKVADKWITDGSEKCLVWDEGCTDEGWYETTLPHEFQLLDNECRALRNFRVALKEALDLKVAMEMVASIGL